MSKIFLKYVYLLNQYFDPMLCLVLIPKQVLYVAYSIYDVVMPLVMHEAASRK